MSPRIVKRARVLVDLAERSEYLRQHNPGAALRFLEQAETTIRRLAELPGTGARFHADHPALSDLRFAPILRFKQDLVFDRPIEGGIEIVRVLHGARDLAGILADDLGIDDEDEAEAAGSSAESHPQGERVAEVGTTQPFKCGRLPGAGIGS